MDRALFPSQEILAFVSGPSTLVFEYVPTTADIVTDGEYTSSASYIKPSPFTNWAVSVPDLAVDLSSVTGMTVELSCEVSVRV